MIDGLSPAQLRAALALIAVVTRGGANRATLELLSIPGFAASYQRGVKDVRTGRTKPWRQVRSDV